MSTSPQIQAATMAKFLEVLCNTLGDQSIPVQQVRLLLSLFTYGQLSQASLDAHTGVAQSSNSRNIAKLGIGETLSTKPGLGLVESFEDLTDRRVKMVRLTPKGLSTMKAALEKATKM